MPPPFLFPTIIPENLPSFEAEAGEVVAGLKSGNLAGLAISINRLIFAKSCLSALILSLSFEIFSLAAVSPLPVLEIASM